MSQVEALIEDIPHRVWDTLVDEFGESQNQCVRGYFPSQSIQNVMKFLEPEQIQQIKGTRAVKDKTESFKTGFDLPEYVQIEEQLKRDLFLNFDRAQHKDFNWNVLIDFLVDSELEDIAIHKLVFRMDNQPLRDHLFKILQEAVNYPQAYDSQFKDRFYFVMESEPPEVDKDYRNVEQAHDSGYLKRLGWSPRTLDLMAIWSHEAWVNSKETPLSKKVEKSGEEKTVGMHQREIEELAFNQRESERPVFGAVNTKLVVNRWRTPFGSGMTDMRYFNWSDDQRGWVRAE